MNREEQLAPLGVQRLKILNCLGGNMQGLEGYFRPSNDINIFAAFQLYAQRLSTTWAEQKDNNLVALLAAARFLSGDISSAEDILTQIPEIPFELDHGTGYCLVAPFHALSASLPLPETLTDTRRWTKGSDTAKALRRWLVEHRDQLHWDEVKGVYLFHLSYINNL